MKQAEESVLERKRNTSCGVLGCDLVAGNGSTRRGSGVDAWWKLESWKFVERNQRKVGVLERSWRVGTREQLRNQEVIVTDDFCAFSGSVMRCDSCCPSLATALPEFLRISTLLKPKF